MPTPEALIERTHQAWMEHERANAPVRVLALCSERIRWMPPDEPAISGKAAIAAWLLDNPSTIVSLVTSQPAISVTGRLASLRAAFETRAIDAAGSRHAARGRHEWVLEAEPDGQWRVLLVSWALEEVSSDVTAPAAGAPSAAGGREDSAAQQITIEPATKSDAAFVRALVPELVAFGPPPWRDARQMIETDTLVIGRALEDPGDDATVLVAKDAHGQPLGFVHLREAGDYYTRGPCGHIADLVVPSAARGRGAGEALLSAAEDWARARGYSLLTLNVFLENARARALYARTGFEAETILYVKALRPPGMLAPGRPAR